ncbi:MAG TPA: hypothetical protein VNA20_16130 [Frankiaceae bacterium]|nr:hypothetical protein [Frankiaceae bacterium]
MLVAAVLTCMSAVVAWRVDAAASAASSHDRQGIIETLRHETESARAEADARTEARTFDRYAIARLEQLAQEELANVDTAAAVEAAAQQRVADRLELSFPEEFGRWESPGRYTTARFDVAARTADLLTAREVRDDSPRLFALAARAKDRRDQLLWVGAVLVLGIAATIVGQVARNRPYCAAGVAGGVIAAMFGAAALTLVGH